MERDGEGMVAIIEGLEDSGIAITLLNNRRCREERLRQKPVGFGFRRPYEVTKTQSSVETSTDNVNRVNKSAQICDGRYASSYQLAHCRVVPSSPPETVPEFPPQRAEPCRTQGNFEVGGLGNGESWHSRGPASPTNSFRNGSNCEIRSVYADRSTRTDAFAHSLRKYPSLSPDRTMSSDFVQKLITYAQTKHLLKNSHQSKSMRSLSDRSPEMKSRNLRTTREMPTKDDNSPKIFGTSTPKNTTEISEEKKRSRYKDSILSETYDYLKSGVPRRSPKNSEMRSMRKMSRCVRETLRQIYDYKPMATLQVCPEASRRYNQYKKVHRTCSRERQPCPKLTAVEVQASLGCDASSTTRYEIPSKKLSPSRQICCFCKKPLPCNCGAGLSKLLHFKETIEPPKLPAYKVPCPCPKDEARDREYRKRIENEIYEWLNEIPVYANECAEAKSTRNAMIKQLSNTLGGLNDNEFDEKGMGAIKKCIDTLPMWYPGDKRDQEPFKEQLADKLLNRVKRVSKKDKFTEEVTRFVNDIVLKGRDSEGHAVNKDNIVDSIVERLKVIALDRPPDDNAYNAELRAEILDALEELPIEVEANGRKELNQKAELLVYNLVKVSPQDIYQSKSRKLSAGTMENTVQRKILEWLNDNPELPNALTADTKENKTMIRELGNTLQKYERNDLNDENVQSKLQEEIKDILENMVKNNGRLDSKSKDRVIRRLIQKLISSGALKNSEKNPVYKNSDINQSISDWLENIPVLSGSSNNDKKKLIQNLGDKLQGLEDEDDLRNEIQKWLSETLDEKGEHMTPKANNDLVDKLVREIRNVPRANKRKQEPISDNTLDNMKRDGEIQNSENDMIEERDYSQPRNRWNNDDAPDSIQEEISRIIDQGPTKLSKSKKQDLKDKIANVLAKKIGYQSRLSEAGSKSLPERNKTQRKSFASHTIPLKSNLKKYVRDEVDDILNKFNITPGFQEDIAESISDTLEKQIADGSVSNKTEQDVYDILQDVDIPEERAAKLTRELVQKADEIAVAIRNEPGNDTSRVPTSKMASRRVSTGNYDYPNTSFVGETTFGREDSHIPYTDKETETFKEDAEKEFLDLLEEVTGEDSVNLKNRRDGVIGEVSCKIGDIIYNPNMLEEDKINEVTKCLRKISLPPKVSKEQFVSELINRIRSSVSENKSDVPRRKEERRISFHPGAESSRISDSYQDDSRFTQKQYQDETFNRSNRKNTGDFEQEFMNELLNIIHDWIDELPIDLNSTEDKGFKETMSKDLASDIVDRLKYLQLNPGVKSTNQEELEHLKYQVFRWLNKLVPADDLSPVLPKTQLLMDRINRVNVPQLVQPSGKRKESKMMQGGIPNYSDALQDEISMWLKDIPPYLLNSSDNSHHHQIVKRLADVIQQQRDNNNINLNDEIEKCLNEIVDDKQNLDKIAEDLKNRLNHKGFTGDTSWFPVQNTSEFIEENFEGGMMDWLKDLPLYQQRSPQEKRTQEKSIKELAKNLKRIAENVQPGDNTDELFMDEIKKHLKQFPMDPEQKYDDQFHRRTAAQLLHYLKGLQMFQDISHRAERPSGEYFTAAIEDWLNSLPMNPRSSITKQSLFGVLKEEFITRLKQLREKFDPSSDNDQIMRKEIKEYLLLLPIEPTKKQDQKFLNDKVEELLKNLQVVPTEQVFERENIKDQILGIINDLPRKSLTVDSTQAYKKPADLLYDNIEKWCEDLPIHLGDSPADSEKVKTIKQNIARKLINKVGELNMNPEIFNDDVLYQDLLIDEAENLLGSVPNNPELESKLPQLLKILTENVNEANHKARDEHTGQVYKQQLKDSVSKTLPTSNLSSEEEASFELLKDSVADAFINLHYVGNDESLKNKYKSKIKDEVSKFCTDFIKRYPNIPIDNTKLNQDLYKALCNVPVPNEDSMKSEVGQARIKDAIYDSVKDLPLKEQLPQEAKQLQQSKIISILAKRLHDMEKEESFHPDANNDERKQKEITKWIKKLPLKPENGDKIDKIATQLVNDLKKTERFRRFSGSSMLSGLMDSNHRIHGKTCSCCPRIPPSTLSIEDSALLRRVRERTPMPVPACKPHRNCKDVAISPCSVDACTQTEIRIWELRGSEELYNGQNMPQSSGRIVQHVEKTKVSGSCAQPDSNYEVSPQVTIREYHWDSTEGSKFTDPPLPNMQSCNPTCPDQKQSSNYVQPVTRSSACKQNVSRSCSPVQSPCSTSHPYVTPRSSNDHEEPSISHREIPCSSAPKRPDMRRERNPFPQPCFNTGPSGTSSRLEECSTSRYNKTFEDFPSKPPRKRQRDFTVHFPDEDNFWDASCRSRMSPITTDEELESISREREKSHEKVRCRCKERVTTKCAGRRMQTCPAQHVGVSEAMRKCSKCSVLHCPYPSFLYFRE